jgi:DNA-binding transcriptional ArsR family regulator
MGRTKVNQYSEEELALYEIGKIIAHPARIRILNLLKDNGSIKLRELTDLLELSRSTINGHLEKLVAGDFIVVDYVEGVCELLPIKPNTIEEFADQIEKWNKFSSKKLTRFERRLNERSKTKTKGKPKIVMKSISQ